MACMSRPSRWPDASLRSFGDTTIAPLRQRRDSRGVEPLRHDTQAMPALGSGLPCPHPDVRGVPMRKRLWPLCLLSLLALMSVSGALAAGTAATVTPATELKRANQPLLVGVKVAPPFVIEDHGRYSGLAIDLWQEIAA